MIKIYSNEIRGRPFLATVGKSKVFSSAFTTSLLALVISEPAAEVGAVAVQVVAGVRGGRGLSWAEATALWAACADVRLVARVLRKARAVAVDVVTGRLSGDGSIGWSSNSFTFSHSHRLPDSTHTHSTLKPDEPVLTPCLAPGVLHLPEVHPSGRVRSIPDNSDSVVCLIAGAASKDPSLVVLERSRRSNAGHNGSVLCHEALQSLLVAFVGVVGPRDLGTLVVVIGGRAGEGWGGVLVGVSRLGCEIQP